MILFGFKLHPFFGKTVVYISGGMDKGTPKHRGRDGTFKEVYFHNCTTAPEAVREEVKKRKDLSTNFSTFCQSEKLMLVDARDLTGF